MQEAAPTYMQATLFQKRVLIAGDAARIAAARRATRGVEGHHYEYTQRRKGGREMPVELCMPQMHHGEGRRCFIAITRDVIDRKRTEAPLRDSAAQSAEAQTMEPEGLTPEFNRYLAKPLEVQALRQVVREALLVRREYSGPGK